jgi:cell division protein FtsN
LRLAQLELARGDRSQAATHLQRLAEDHPAALSSPRTNLSVARAYQELNDQPHACSALAAAQRTAAPADIELRNQIDYAARQCPTLDTTTKAVAATPSPPPQTPVAAKPVVASPPPAAPPTPTPAAPTPAAPTPAAPAPAAAVATSSKGAFTIQVAAYSTQAPATALAAKLTARGFPARVSGTSAPFRVRIGRYATHAAAEAAAADLKSKQISGFITDAEPPSPAH